MIDWNRVASLREEVGQEDFEEVVELFLDEVDAEIEALTESLDGEKLAEKLHFLKGSALNLGFTDFSILCQAGESQLTQNPASTFDLTAVKSVYQNSRDQFLEELPAQITS